MRRSDIVFGVLLILFIIDFTRAAPVLAQEKRHAYVDMVHTPKDMINVLGKRGGEELQKMRELLEEYVMSWPMPFESSGTHAAPSTLAPPGPEHGSMGDVLAPASNPGLSEDPNFDPWANLESPPQARPAAPTVIGQAHGNQVDYLPQPPIDPGFDWNNLEDQPPLKRPKLALLEEPGQAHEDQAHTQQPNPEQLRYSGLVDWFGVDELLPLVWPQPELSSSKMFDPWLAHEDQMVHTQQQSPGLNPGPSSAGPSNQQLPTGPGYGSSEGLYDAVVQGPPPRPDSTDPELHSDHQLLSTDTESPDPAAVAAAKIYAVKGKTKELRRIPGTTRDVGNTPRETLQPV